MTPTVKQRFDQMMGRCKNILHARDKDIVRNDMRRLAVMLFIVALEA